MNIPEHETVTDDPADWIYDPDEDRWIPRLANTDPFDDDTPLECGVENPETCEACD